MQSFETVSANDIDVEQAATISDPPPTGVNAEQQITHLLRENPVVLISKTTCPFCIELKQTLVSYGIKFAILEIDTSANCAEIQAYLLQSTRISTVPILFAGGEVIGSCMDIKSMEHSGVFTTKLAPYLGKAKVKRATSTRIGLLWYPEVVNGHVARLTSLLSCIYTILCIGFYRRPPTQWAVLGLAVDYLLRLTYGSQYSVGGACASMLLTYVQPRWACGPPKQFAALCGLFFSTFAAGLYLGNHPAGGAVVLAMLMFAAGLEGCLDFCLGCWMFGHAIRLGLVPASIYSPYLNLLPAKKWAYEHAHKAYAFPPAENQHVLLSENDTPTPVDLIRKDRLETEYKLADVNVLRNARIDLFAVPMTIAAVGFMLLEADNADFETERAYKTMGVFAAIMFCLTFLLYAAKGVFYPRKVVKEWYHPVMGNFFSTVSITLTLEGILLMPSRTNGGVTLVWIGSVLQMLITVLRLADLIFDPTSEEFFNPSLMMAPVGNFISAVGFAQFRLVFDGYDNRGNMNYVSIARLWFGIAALFAVVLFTITFRKALLDHHSDERLRPMLWVWLATSSIAGPAYIAVAGYSADAVGGVLFQSLWCISLLFFTLNAVGMLRNFYTYQQDMSNWIMPFSLCAFSANTITYYRTVHESRDLFFVLSCISLACAAFSASVCGFHTISWMLDGSLFTPRPKWGPLSSFKLLHECLRFSIPRITTIFAQLSPLNANAIDHALVDMDGLLTTFRVHSEHEDHILFPKVRRFFPGLHLGADAEHHALHAQVDRIQAAVARYRSGTHSEVTARELLDAMNAILPVWQPQVEEHLRNEESTMTVVVRKYFPLEYQIEVSREVFNSTSSADWRKVLPFVVNNLPHYTWKARYVKALLWGNALRAQEVGLMLYHSVDSDLWNMLVREIPHLAPRGAALHKRIY